MKICRQREDSLRLDLDVSEASMLMRHLVGALQESRAISISAADQRESGAPRKPRRAEPLLRARFLKSECENGEWRTVSAVIWQGGKRCQAPFSGTLTRAKHNNNGFAVNETTFEQPGSSGECLKCCLPSKNSRIPGAASTPTVAVIAGKRLPSLLFTR